MMAPPPPQRLLQELSSRIGEGVVTALFLCRDPRTRAFRGSAFAKVRGSVRVSGVRGEGEWGEGEGEWGEGEGEWGEGKRSHFALCRQLGSKDDADRALDLIGYQQPKGRYVVRPASVMRGLFVQSPR